MTRQEQFDVIHKIIQKAWDEGGFTLQDQNHALGNNPFTEMLTSILIDSGVGTAERFEIEYDYDHNGVDYVDCSKIVPIEWEEV